MVNMYGNQLTVRDGDQNDGNELFIDHMLQAVQQHYVQAEYLRVLRDKQVNYNLAMLRGHLDSLYPMPLMFGPTVRYVHELWQYLDRDLVEFVQALASAASWEPEPCLIDVLAHLMASSRGRLLVYLNPSWLEPATIFSLNVAASGSKKSMVIGHLKKPFVDYGFDLLNERQSKIGATQRQNKSLATARGNYRRKAIKAIVNHCSDGLTLDHETLASKLAELDQELEKLDGFHKDERGLPRIIVDHITTKRLAKVLSENGEAVLISGAEDEIIERMAYDKRIEKGLWLKGHTGEQFICENMNNMHIALNNPIITLVYAVQPEIARRIYTKDSMASIGLTPRLVPFFIAPQAPAGFGPSNSGIIAGFDGYCGKIQHNLNRYYTQKPCRDISHIQVAPQAYLAVKNLETQMAGLISSHSSLSEGFVAYLRKLHGLAVRFAVGFHLWRYPEPEKHYLSHLDMLCGIELAKVTVDHALFAFHPCGLGAYEDAKRVLHWMLKTDVNQFVLSDMAKGTSMPNSRLFNALDLLESRCIIAQYIEPKRVRVILLHSQARNFKLL